MPRAHCLLAPCYGQHSRFLLSSTPSPHTVLVVLVVHHLTTPPSALLHSFSRTLQQEKKFKTELHEKEQEVVRLHTILRSTEMNMHEHRAASAAKDVEISALRARLDQASACLARQRPCDAARLARAFDLRAVVNVARATVNRRRRKSKHSRVPCHPSKRAPTYPHTARHFARLALPLTSTDLPNAFFRLLRLQRVRTGAQRVGAAQSSRLRRS